MATTTNLDSLVINYLTQEQYDEAQQAGTLNANQLYLTPDVGNYLEKSVELNNDYIELSGSIGWVLDEFGAGAKLNINAAEVGKGQSVISFGSKGIYLNFYSYTNNASPYIKLNSGGACISGLVTPTDDADAATKKYVDDSIPKVYSSTNTGGYLTMATLPIYNGTVV